MLYGTEGGGRGRKSKYMLLPRGGRVKFDFLNAPAGWPRPVWFFELTCLVRLPDRSALAGLSIGLGRPAGEFEKPNWTRPPGRSI
jgi:hypothetical protein